MSDAELIRRLDKASRELSSAVAGSRGIDRMTEERLVSVGAAIDDVVHALKGRTS